MGLHLLKLIVHIEPDPGWKKAVFAPPCPHPLGSGCPLPCLGVSSPCVVVVEGNIVGVTISKGP